MSTPTNPMELFDAIRERAVTMLKTAFMESGRAWPGDDSDVFRDLLMPVLGVGIAASTEFFASHPEFISLAGQPMCVVCREPVQTMQVGVDPARTESETEIVKVAWPCGHIQKES